MISLLKGDYMSYYKIPIIEKIYEAYSAIADDRVHIDGNDIRSVSSDYTKTYTITKMEDTYVSNDNMSFWKATIGYPILATMMLNGELKYNKDIIKYFKNINWKKLNTKHKNDYILVSKIILDEMQRSGIDSDFIKSETEKVYDQIKSLNLPYKKSKIFPPK